MSSGFAFGRNWREASDRLLHPEKQKAESQQQAVSTAATLLLGKSPSALLLASGSDAPKAPLEPLSRSSTFGFSNKPKSQKDLPTMAPKDWPTHSSEYELLEDCGRGVSATVHKALCLPFNEIVAVKKMNLESMNCNLDEIIQEAHTMKQYSHVNVLPLHCSFVDGQDLWLVMPFIAGGSVLHIMKYAYPEGLDEVCIATIMRDVLKALDYVHKNGAIHRDIKAGNILIDKGGAVKLADFGVAAKLDRDAEWGHDRQTRMTFVGTPCWMAPEVMEQTQGYDSSADIWSCGITILEMAHGHAPFAKFPPMKVLLMTLQNPPPTLDDKGKKHFSKLIKDVVTRCLQKDPSLRPTAAQLLEHKFFKQAKDDEYLSRHILANLPTLSERVKLIRQGKAATSATENDADFARSQEEYKKGVSSWNFDVASLKAQAAILDEDVLPSICEGDEVDPLMMSARMSAHHLPSPSALLHPPPAAAPAVAPPAPVAVPPAADAPPSTAASGAVSPTAFEEPSRVPSPVPPPPPAVQGSTGSLAGSGGPPSESASDAEQLLHEISLTFPGLVPPIVPLDVLLASDPRPQLSAMYGGGGGSVTSGGAAPAAESTSYSLTEARPSARGDSSPAPKTTRSQKLPTSTSPPQDPSVFRRSLTSEQLEAPPPQPPLSPSHHAIASGLVELSSPTHMSRDPSGAVPSTITTPTGAKKEKKGRFQVYEDGEVPPPLSPGPGAVDMLASPHHHVALVSARDSGNHAPLLTASSTASASHAHTTSTSGAAPPLIAAVSLPSQPAAVSGRDGGAAAAAAGSRDGGGVAAASSSGVPSAHPAPAAVPSSHRVSEDGLVPRLSGVMEGEEAAPGGVPSEPKKRGRFKIIEEAGSDGSFRNSMTKANSTANLMDRGGASHQATGNSSMSREVSAALKDSMGRPPAAPHTQAAASTSAATAAVTTAALPLTAVLPRLQELLDHQAQQTQALQRLISAVQDVDKGRGSGAAAAASPPGLFARWPGAPARSLFTDRTSPTETTPTQLTPAASMQPGDSEAGDTDLRHRMAYLEEENVRLRLRNHQLEAMLKDAHGGGASDAGGSCFTNSFTGGSSHLDLPQGSAQYSTVSSSAGASPRGGGAGAVGGGPGESFSQGRAGSPRGGAGTGAGGPGPQAQGPAGSTSSLHQVDQRPPSDGAGQVPHTQG